MHPFLHWDVEDESEDNDYDIEDGYDDDNNVVDNEENYDNDDDDDDYDDDEEEEEEEDNGNGDITDDYDGNYFEKKRWIQTLYLSSTCGGLMATKMYLKNSNKEI